MQNESKDTVKDNIIQLEIWKVIPSTNGKYEASNFGRIRNSKTQRILKQQNDIHGYKVLTLRIIPNQQINARVHQLVTEAFLGERPKKYVVNHKDGNKTNNYINNLEYVTSSENNQHALDIGLRKPADMTKFAPKGENHCRAKITEETVVQILLIRKNEGIGCRKIAKRLGISEGTVDSILLGKSWKYVKIA